MNDSDLPLFSNTCGKLFHDRIVFASTVKETAIEPQSIKNVTFSRGISIGGVLFALLPCILLALPMFIKVTEHEIKMLFYSIGFILLAVSIIKIRKTYTISLYMKDGTIRTIKVWEGNRHEARKFVDKVRERFLRKANGM